jgi:hypothetical protein
MYIKKIRELRANNGNCEILFEIDSEFEKMYMEEMNTSEMDVVKFSEFINKKMKEALEGEEWKLE